MGLNYTKLVQEIMCVGPGTLLWEGHSEVNISVFQVPIDITGKPTKREKSTATEYLLAVSTAYISNLLFTTTCSATHFYR